MKGISEEKAEALIAEANAYLAGASKESAPEESEAINAEEHEALAEEPGADGAGEETPPDVDETDTPETKLSADEP